MSRPIKEYTPIRDSYGRAFKLHQEIRKTGGDWIYVVDSPTDNHASPESPLFLNGWTNMGGRYALLRFRWLLDGGIEIEGVVTGGTVPSEIFLLPGAVGGEGGSYLRDNGDLPVPGVNIADNSHAAFEVRSDGTVWVVF